MEIIPEQIIEKYKKDFDLFFNLYKEYNSHTNISSIREKADVYKKHFEDSLASLKHILSHYNSEKNSKRVLEILDLGSGGGFPAIPLAIALKNHPQLRITALDSNNKKTKFIELVKENLKLEKLSIIQARAEELSKEINHREHYNIVVSRALANLPILLEYAIPFLKLGGIFLAYKKSDIEEEIKASEKIVVDLGAALHFADLNSEMQGRATQKPPNQILIYQKIKKTPEKYPRANSIITRTARKALEP